MAGNFLTKLFHIVFLGTQLRGVSLRRVILSFYEGSILKAWISEIILRL